MKFRKGDKVRFLNEKGEGVITRITGRQAYVDVDGFEIPYPLESLVPAYTEDDRPKQPAISPPVSPIEATPVPLVIKPKPVSEHTAEGVFIALVPTDERLLLSSPLLLFLINATGYHILYTCSVKVAEGYRVIGSGRLDPGAEVMMKKIARSDIEKYAQLKTDVVFFAEDTYEHQPPVSEIVKLRAVKFYKESTYTDNHFFDSRAYVTPIAGTEASHESDYHESLSKQDIARMILEKERKQQKGRSQPHVASTGELEQEIDLHIEELVENKRGMSNSEIIVIQLNHLRARLEEAIAGHVKKITFIHGVGNGRLKQEVRRILSTYEGIRFHDAPYHRYGFGATEVIIRG